MTARDWMLTTRVEDAMQFGSLSAALAATAYELDHDPAAARAVMAPLGGLDDTAFLQADAINAFSALPAYWAAAERDDWAAALADTRTVDAWLATRQDQQKLLGLLLPVWIRPLEALAQARSGDIPGAQAVISATPMDCYLCLRIRGQIAAEARDWPAADRWFAEAVRQGPSLPFAYADWGQTLLARGDADAAISKLQLAHAKGPNFADPLELWGEALMQKGDFSGAAAEFAAAARAAPRWGRDRLRWGQALARQGRADEAKTQWRAAARMEMSAADRVELQDLLKGA